MTITSHSERKYTQWLSTFWPAFAEFYDVDASVVGPTIPRMSFQDDRVDVRHFLSFF